LQSTENNTGSEEIIYNPEDHYVNPNNVFQIGDICVEFTRWHLDYSVISFYPIPNGDGITTWQRQYFY
jgi:hypothetical protein